MRSTGITARCCPGGFGCPNSDGLTAGRGRPPSVQACRLVSGKPGFTTELGTPAMTPLTSWGKWAPSSSAASPPRDSPATRTWRGSTPGWARSSLSAPMKYSRGMLRRV